MELYAKDHDSDRYQEACDWFVQLREATDDSGIVTGRSGDRDRRNETVKHSAL